MKTYVKTYNRSLPLYATQYWYRGEHPGIEKIAGVKFETIFYYEDTKATSVYYEKESTQKAFEKYLEYYLETPGRFEDDVDLYKKLHKESLAAIEQKDLAKLVSIPPKIWPILSGIMLLGDMEAKTPRAQELQKMAAQARAETDRALYDIGNGVWDLIESHIPVATRAFLTIEEILSKKYPSLDEIGRRQQRSIYTHDSLTVGLSLNDFAKENKFKLEGDEPVRDVREFSGNVACRGKVTGRVRVVLEFIDMFKFQEGEVLVSSMTVPDFMPVMKKACAFVTDEGGITCHAAIVAREMKKPCIIGTKIATQVLKDGDLVEVDADNGIIRKI